MLQSHYCPRQLNDCEIRLLSYRREDSSGQLHCELVCHRSARDLPYKASSYARRSIRMKSMVLCNDERLHVSESTHSALQCFSTPGLWTALKPLWIDAICIYQVRQMRSVCECATEVLIWLGPQRICETVAPSPLQYAAETITCRGLFTLSEPNEITDSELGLPLEFNFRWDDLFRFCI